MSGADPGSAGGAQIEHDKAYAAYKNAVFRLVLAVFAAIGAVAFAGEAWDKLSELESGKVDHVWLWQPVAGLYTHFGKSAAMAPFAVLCLLAIATSVAWGRDAWRHRQNVPDLKRRLRQDPEIQSIMHNHQGRVPTRTWVLIAILGAMLGAIGLFALLH